jgi:hypothetical protein
MRQGSQASKHAVITLVMKIAKKNGPKNGRLRGVFSTFAHKKEVGQEKHFPKSQIVETGTLVLIILGLCPGAGTH